jgi:hypothetical protein
MAPEITTPSVVGGASAFTTSNPSVNCAFAALFIIPTAANAATVHHPKSFFMLVSSCIFKNNFVLNTKQIHDSCKISVKQATRPISYWHFFERQRQ